MDKFLLFIILFGVALFFLNKVLSKFKTPKIAAVSLVTGGVKTGKTTFAVNLAIKNYKRNLRSVKFRNFFAKLFRKEVEPLPLLYSNIPLAIPYVPVTRELLQRKVRPVYKSVVLLSEASLVADSQLFKDPVLNEELMLFVKLFGHMSKGGYLIMDTQSTSDLHYAFKRCLSEYFYIHSLGKYLFFNIANVRECRYSEDGSVLSIDTDDSEEKLKKVLISRKVWKYFDAYCYSAITDNLPEAKNIKTAKTLKIKKIPSFRMWINKELNDD